MQKIERSNLMIKKTVKLAVAVFFVLDVAAFVIRKKHEEK